MKKQNTKTTGRIVPAPWGRHACGVLVVATLLSSCAAWKEGPSGITSKPVSTQSAIIAALTEAQRIQAEALTKMGAKSGGSTSVDAGIRDLVRELVASRLTQNTENEEAVAEDAKAEALQSFMGAIGQAYEELTGRKLPGQDAYGDKMTGRRPSRDPQVREDWWMVKEGTTLRENLKEWAARADWKLVWKVPYEYPIEASAVFTGKFPDAVHQIVTAFEKANPPVYVTFYKNRVAVVRIHDANQ